MITRIFPQCSADVKTCLSHTSSLYTSKILFLFILPLFLNNAMQAQDTTHVQLSNVNIYADAGFLLAGQASINIEKRIYSGEKVCWYGRIGAGLAGVIMVGGGPGGIAAITMLTGKSKNHFEMNAGVFYVFSNDVPVLPLIDLGYRYQKPEGGLIFKAKVGALGIGLGLGYGF